MKKEAFNEYRISSSHTYDEMRGIILNACKDFNCIMSKRQCEREGERQLILFYYKVVHQIDFLPLFFCADQLLIILSESPDGSTTVTASSIPLIATSFQMRYRYCSRIMEMFIQNMGSVGKKVYLSPAQAANGNEAKMKYIFWLVIPAILIALIVFFVM